MRVVICVPSGREWSAKFGMSLAGMAMHFIANRLPWAKSQSLTIYNKRGSILPQLREELVRDALKADATHILFVDSDQTFPPDTLNRLLAWKLPFVACNVVVKTFPAVPTARALDPLDNRGRVVYSTGPGLEKVWRIGLGVALIDTQVFRAIEEPWFLMKYMPNNTFMGEDWYFCEKVEAAGFPIHVDHGLSLQVGHIGDLEYIHDYCGAERRLTEALRTAYKLGAINSKEPQDAFRSGSPVQGQNDQDGKESPAGVQGQSGHRGQEP